MKTKTKRGHHPRHSEAHKPWYSVPKPVWHFLVSCVLEVVAILLAELIKTLLHL